MCSRTKTIFCFFFTICIQVFYSPSILSSPIPISETKIYYREGFSQADANTIWTDIDSHLIRVENEKSVSLPPRRKSLFETIFLKNRTRKEFSLQIQIPSTRFRTLSNPGLKIHQIGENWIIFQNGRILQDNDTQVRKKTNPLSIPLLRNLTRIENKQEIETITFAISGYEDSSNFGIVINENDRIDEFTKIEFESIEIFPFLSSGIFLILGIYLVYLYSRIRRSKEVFYFGLFQLFYSLYAISFSNYANLWIGNLQWIDIMQTNILYFSFISIVCFHDCFLLNRIQFFSKIIFSITFFILFLNTFLNNFFPNFLSLLTIIETPHLFFYFLVMSKIIRKDLLRNKKRSLPLPTWKVIAWNRAGILTLVIFSLAVSIYFETFLEWKFKIKTPIVIIASISYSIFIAFYVIRKIEDGLVQKTKLQTSLMNEKIQFELEKYLAIQKERQNTFNDIHDETSADLTFIRLKIEKFIESNKISPENGREVISIINRVSSGIRQKLSSMDDEKNIASHLTDGIILLLLRKYQTVGKISTWDSKEIEGKEFSLSHKSIECISKIIREIANNDIKYGSGISHWKFFQEDDSLVFRLMTESVYDKDLTLPGYGSKKIRELAMTIHSDLTESLENGSYRITLKIYLLKNLKVG